MDYVKLQNAVSVLDFYCLSFASQRVQKHDSNNSIQFDYSFYSRGLILGIEKEQIFKMRLF